MKVSVLIPVYNAGKYLRQCLDSVVGQTHQDLQIVVVDDGSSDDSLSICEEYAARYPFVEVYHQENAGVAAARNALLEKAKGDYTIFVDSDDWIEPDMIEGLLHCIADYDLDIAICGNVKESGDSVTEADTFSPTPKIDTQEEAIRKFILHKEMNGSLWNKLIRTGLFESLSSAKDIWYGEDALMTWQVLQRAKRIGTVPSQYYHYRMNDASISHQKFGVKKMSGHKVWAAIHADTLRDWPQFKREAESSYAISDMWLMYYAALDNYPFDENIHKYRNHVRHNILDILRADHIKTNKKIFALGMAISYRLGGYMIRRHK